MPRPASRFIAKLTHQQIQKLQEIKDGDDSSRIRHRAHAVLLSYQGTSIDELAKVFQSTRLTISHWLNRWDAQKFAGLADKPRPGSPSKLTQSEQTQVLELLQQSPHNPAAVLSQVKKEVGKEISRSTLKRLAKKSGLVWKRMRKSLTDKQDQKKVPA